MKITRTTADVGPDWFTSIPEGSCQVFNPTQVVLLPPDDPKPQKIAAPAGPVLQPAGATGFGLGSRPAVVRCSGNSASLPGLPVPAQDESSLGRKLLFGSMIGVTAGTVAWGLLKANTSYERERFPANRNLGEYAEDGPIKTSRRNQHLIQQGGFTLAATGGFYEAGRAVHWVGEKTDIGLLRAFALSPNESLILGLVATQIVPHAIGLGTGRLSDKNANQWEWVNPGDIGAQPVAALAMAKPSMEAGKLVERFYDRAHKEGIGAALRTLPRDAVPFLAWSAGGYLVYRGVPGKFDGVYARLSP